jgi:hypothetical protein
MEEKKFTVCGLAIEHLALEVNCIKGGSPNPKSFLGEGQLFESEVALHLDDTYEFCVLREPDDESTPDNERALKDLMRELPNYRSYRRKYRWPE